MIAIEKLTIGGNAQPPRHRNRAPVRVKSRHHDVFGWERTPLADPCAHRCIDTDDVGNDNGGFANHHGADRQSIMDALGRQGPGRKAGHRQAWRRSDVDNGSSGPDHRQNALSP